MHGIKSNLENMSGCHLQNSAIHGGHIYVLPMAIWFSIASGWVDKAIAQSAKLTSVEYASDVEWLSEVIAKSKTPSRNEDGSLEVVPKLKPFQSDTLIGWNAERQRIREWWINYLGYDPEARRELPVVEVLSTTVDQGVVREHWRYRTRGEWVTEAFLLYPSSRDASDEHSSEMLLRPAAVVLHPTVDMSIDEPAGVRSSDGIAHGPRALGWHLAKLGFVVICPRNYLWPANDRIEAAAQSDLWMRRRANQEGTSKMLGMGKMLYDVQVAADLLLDHGMADPNQLSVLGHSLGAKEALYAMAFDERFRAGAASEGGIGIGFSNWDAEWYLGSGVKHSSFSHEHHELLALIAPRAFLVVAGDSADGDRGWPLLVEAQSRYSLFGARNRLGQFNHRQGHPLNESGSQRMLEWVDTYGRMTSIKGSKRELEP